MSALKNLRDQLMTDLSVLDAPVFASWPTSISLPCLYVMPPLSNIYITAGPNFGGEFTVLMDVVILADHAEATESLEILETLIEAALVNTADWVLVGVEPPSPITVTESGAEYLGTVLHLSKPFHL